MERSSKGSSFSSFSGGEAFTDEESSGDLSEFVRRQSRADTEGDFGFSARAPRSVSWVPEEQGFLESSVSRTSEYTSIACEYLHKISKMLGCREEQPAALMEEDTERRGDKDEDKNGDKDGDRTDVMNNFGSYIEHEATELERRYTKEHNIEIPEQTTFKESALNSS